MRPHAKKARAQLSNIERTNWRRAIARRLRSLSSRSAHIRHHISVRERRINTFLVEIKRNKPSSNFSRSPNLRVRLAHALRVQIM